MTNTHTLANNMKASGLNNFQRWLSIPDSLPRHRFAFALLKCTTTCRILYRKATEPEVLPIVKVVLFIFTIAAVSVVLYIFFLRHRCCLILIRHLQPGSEELSHRVPSTPLNLPRCYWLRAVMEASSLPSEGPCPNIYTKNTKVHNRGLVLNSPLQKIEMFVILFFEHTLGY